MSRRTVPRPEDLRRIQSRALAHAYDLLASLDGSPAEPVRVQASDDVNEAALLVQRLRGPIVLAGPGRFLSTIEQAIYDALAAGPLSGKEIARAIGMNYKGTIKAVLSNLCDRGVLISHRSIGYRRTPLPRSD